MNNQMLPLLIWRLTFSAVCLFAIIRGRRPERLTAVVLIIADILNALPLRSLYWKPIEPTVFFIDLYVAVFFVWLALSSSRWWPLWAAAFYLLAVIMLVINVLDPTIRPYAYYVGEQMWDYLGLMAIFLGVLIEGRRDVSPHASSSPSAR